MAGLYYQPVGLPSLGGSAQTSGKAADLISSGLSGLGDKITGLGDRRQRRLDEEQARKNARGLEILQLAAANATSEAELDSIAGQLGLLPGGNVKDAVVIPGSAAVIDARRSAIIGDNKSRGDARTSVANAGLKEVELTDAERTSAAEANLADAKAVYAQDLARLQGMAFSDDPAYAQFAVDLNNRISESHGITSNDIFDQAETNRTLTSATNTQLANDALSRTESQTGIEKSIGSRAVTASEQRRAVYEDQIAYENSERAIKKREDFETYDRFIADRQLNGTSNEDIIQDVRSSDYPPEAKTYMLEKLREGPSLDQTNPLTTDERLKLIQPEVTPLSQGQSVLNGIINTIGGTSLPTNGSLDLPTSAMVSGISGAVDTAIQSSPDMRIYEQGSRLNDSEELKNFVGDIGNYASDYFRDQGVKFTEGEERTIKSIQNETGLSDGEIIAIVGATINNESWPLLPDNLKEDAFRKRARAYQNGRSLIETDYKRLQSSRSTAQGVETEIKALEAAQARAAREGDQDKVDRYARQIGSLKEDLKRVSGELQVRVGQNGR